MRTAIVCTALLGLLLFLLGLSASALAVAPRQGPILTTLQTPSSSGFARTATLRNTHR